VAFDLPDEGKKLLALVQANQAASESRHKNHRERWEELYALYRSHKAFRDWYQRTGENDRDTGLKDQQRLWGEELFIPRAFETVEQVLPRVVTQLPTVPIAPRGDTLPENVENMRTLVEMQHRQVGYDLVLQEIAKSGFIFGLGVGKGPFWRTETRSMPVVVPGVRVEWAREMQEKTLFDDPDFEDVDIFDFFWDPFAKSLKASECGWVIHRTWRSTAYCIRRLVTPAEKGGWNNPFAFPPSDVEGMASGTRFGTFHQKRLAHAGHSDLSLPESAGGLHEVWEYHDGKQVVTVLDRQVPVQVGPNPAAHGEIPFHAFRPTTSGVRELVGIGEIEPIRDLQLEINHLRTGRRDNADFVLQRAYAYADGFVDPDNLKVGPGIGIPVNGDPRDLLFPLPVQDIPNSGYQEEASLLADIERATGLADSGTTTSDTATGAQIVHQAGSVRLRYKAGRLLKEVVAPQATQQVLLNQQRIVAERTMAMPETEAQPGVRGQKWRQVKLGPRELAGDMYALAADENTMMPDNVAQDRQDGMQLWNMWGNNPNVDQRELMRRVATLMGVKQAEQLLAPDNRVPPAVLDILIANGIVDEQTLQGVVEHAMQMEERERAGERGDQQAVEA
jgi:hypothetical protein